jgi:hypothetical protein
VDKRWLKVCAALKKKSGMEWPPGVWAGVEQQPPPELSGILRFALLKRPNRGSVDALFFSTQYFGLKAFARRVSPTCRIRSRFSKAQSASRNPNFAKHERAPHYEAAAKAQVPAQARQD